MKRKKRDIAKHEIIEDIEEIIKNPSVILPDPMPEDHPLLKKIEEHNIPLSYLRQHLNSLRLSHAYKFVADRIKDDGMLDDKEYKEIEEEYKRLAVFIDEDYLETLNGYRNYFKIISNTLSPVDVGISLDKNEKCYMSCPVKWSEFRKVPTGTINYAGPVARIKICKGLSYRAGSIKVQRPTTDEIVDIDSGTLYITDKKIIFMGSFGNKVIPLSKVLCVTEYGDALSVQRPTGKSPFLYMEDAHKANLLISRYLK